MEPTIRADAGADLSVELSVRGPAGTNLTAKWIAWVPVGSSIESAMAKAIDCVAPLLLLTLVPIYLASVGEPDWLLRMVVLTLLVAVVDYLRRRRRSW